MEHATVAEVSLRESGGVVAALGPSSPASLDTVEDISNLLDQGKRAPAMARIAQAYGVIGRTVGCGRYTLWRLDGDTLTVAPALCGQWACSVCGPRRLGWFVRNLAGSKDGMQRGVIETHGLSYFWTLTMSSGSGTVRQNLSSIKRAWNQSRTSLMARYGKFSYVWTMETHRSGYPHLHVLCSTYLDHARVSATWKSATSGSPVVWVRRLSDPRRGSYIAKYCSKTAMLLHEQMKGEPSRWKVYSKSRDIGFTSFLGKGEPGWEVARLSYSFVQSQARVGGYERLKGGSDGLSVSQYRVAPEEWRDLLVFDSPVNQGMVK